MAAGRRRDGGGARRAPPAPAADAPGHAPGPSGARPRSPAASLPAALLAAPHGRGRCPGAAGPPGRSRPEDAAGRAGGRRRRLRFPRAPREGSAHRRHRARGEGRRGGSGAASLPRKGLWAGSRACQLPEAERVCWSQNGREQCAAPALKARPRPGPHPKQRGQQAEGRSSAPLLCSGESPAGALHPAPGPSAQEGHGPVGASPKEGHEVDKRIGAPPLRRQAEKVGAVQPGEGKVVWGLMATFQYPKGPPSGGKPERLFIRNCVIGQGVSCRDMTPCGSSSCYSATEEAQEQR
ncbi:translation initiation factor IF-2-like [Manacus candei]|uniref:translation initiation factor IF-2-like n=1 Tax=Manacus candei TaxID=415023 RepID=UPI0022280C0A|nr:translation initiation factor IF-2-like [Manacus candei]